MTNFVIGAVAGFLICVWAVQTTPATAFSALWMRLEQVQEVSAAANQAYDAMHGRQRIEPAAMTTTTMEPTAYR
jgi:hypothetical protein